MKKIGFFLFFLIGMLSFQNISASENYLIKVGTGNYQITVTKDTKIVDITKILGEAKVVTDSPFGGHAYSFYTDRDYSNYLFLETDEEESIVSYGSVDPSYKTLTYSYDSDYNYRENGVLHGCLYNVDGKIKGGVYYNKDKVMNYNEIVNKYKTNYENNETKYLYSLSKHGVAMFNAISKNLSYNNGIVFDDEFFYQNMQLKELGSSYKKMLESSDRSHEYKGIKLKEKVDFTNSVYYILNPLIFGSLASFANGRRNTTFTIEYMLKNLDGLVGQRMKRVQEQQDTDTD